VREKQIPFCPAYNMDRDYPATLLLHGDQDTDVPCQQSIQMAAALSQHGIPNQLILFKGGGHGIDADTKNPEVKRVLDEAGIPNVSGRRYTCLS
jgi:dipeptidyl aminopeptidase/acylaminoacyl peptidase